MGSMTLRSTPYQLPTVSLIPRCAGTPGMGLFTRATSEGPSVSIGQLERSRPTRLGWFLIDWMNDGHAATLVARSRSTMVSASSGSKRSRHRIVNPLCNAPPSTRVPPIQKKGNAQKTLRSPGEAGRAPGVAVIPDDPDCTSSPKCAVVRTIEPWEWTTPLGSALDPEV